MNDKQLLEIDEYTDLTVKIDMSEIASSVPFDIILSRDLTTTTSVSISEKQLVLIINFLINVLMMYQKQRKGQNNGS